VSPDVDKRVKTAMDVLSQADIARASTERRLETISKALADAIKLLSDLIDEVDEREAQLRMWSSCRDWVCEFRDLLVDNVSRSTNVQFEGVGYGGISRAMRREDYDREISATAAAPVTAALTQFLRLCNLSVDDFEAVMDLKGASDDSFHGRRRRRAKFNGDAAQALLVQLPAYKSVAQLAKWVEPMEHVVEAVRDGVAKRAG
jgi:hypothetical protein